MKRTLKKIAAVVAPEFLKSRFRAALYGFRPAGVDLGLRIEDGADGIPVASTDDGFRMRLTPAAVDDVRFHFSDNGDSLEEMHGFMRAARAQGGMLFDVGSHHGLFSDVFCLAARANRAIGFEPSPVLRAAAGELRELNGLGGVVTFRAAAVGSSSGELGGWTDGHGFIQFGAPPAGTPGFAVEMTTIDDEARRMGADPDVIKIDVEGAEHEVLLGAREVLARRRPLLFLELHMDLLERSGVRPREIVKLLGGLGYRFETCLGKPLRASAVSGSPQAVLRVVAR